MGGGFCPFAAPGYMVSANVLEERAPACSFLGASGCVQTAYSSLDGIPGLTISLLRDTDLNEAAGAADATRGLTGKSSAIIKVVSLKGGSHDLPAKADVGRTPTS